ncbi:MAG: cation diffusion facilitator family transporter [Acidimicrobiales bacterium]
MAVGGEAGNRAVIAALIGNTTIAIVKFIAFALTRSSSMLAEAVHSVADAGNQALLLLGGRQAKKAADEEHQFGYGRERYFWSFVVALVLFVLGSAFALYHGYDKVRHPHEVDNFGIALGVLAVAIVIEAFSFRTAIVESIPLKGDLTWWQFIRRSRVPELPVVLLEDLGAQIGLVFAFVAVVLGRITGNWVWDGIGSLAIGVLLGIIAVILIIEMRSLLIGEGARPGEMAKIRGAIENAPGVERIIHLRTQHLGPEELLVGAKLVFDGSYDVTQLSAAVDGVEAAVRAVVPYARPMYIEPDLLRDEATLRSGEALAQPPAGL